MSNMPWFRFYNEALSDRKVARICKETKQPKALVIGVWVTFLSLASESPERGRLLISDGLAFTADEIIEETGLDEDTFMSIVKGFMNYGMLEHDGETWTICHWHNRQPPSDNSTERVRRHRQRQRQKEQNETDDDGNDTLPHVIDETLPKRYSNGLDKEEETDKELEQDAPAPARDEAHRKAIKATEELMTYWSDLTGKRPRKNELENEWVRPLNDLWIRAGRDTERSKKLLRDGRKSMLERGFTPFKPSGVVPAIIAQLDGVGVGINGTAANGHMFNDIWQKVVAHVKRGQPPTDPALLAAVREFGWPRLQSMNEKQLSFAQGEFINVYRRLAATAQH